MVIASPTGYHEAQIAKSLAADKAVFCEKPVASDSKAVERCYALAETKGLPLFCAFQRFYRLRTISATSHLKVLSEFRACRRFDPSFFQLREAIRKGEIGKVHLIKSCSRDPSLPSETYLKTSSTI